MMLNKFAISVVVVSLVVLIACDNKENNNRLEGTKWYRLNDNEIQYLYFTDSKMMGWRKDSWDTCYYWYIDPYKLENDTLSLYEGYWFSLEIRRSTDSLIFERGNRDHEYARAKVDIDTLIENQCEEGDIF